MFFLVLLINLKVLSVRVNYAKMLKIYAFIVFF